MGNRKGNVSETSLKNLTHDDFRDPEVQAKAQETKAIRNQARKDLKELLAVALMQVKRNKKGVTATSAEHIIAALTEKAEAGDLRATEIVLDRELGKAVQHNTNDTTITLADILDD